MAIPKLPAIPAKPENNISAVTTTNGEEKYEIDSPKDVQIDVGKDLEMNVHNDKKIVVGNDQTVQIIGKSLFHVGKDSTVYIDGNEEKFIQGDNVEKHFGKTGEWFVGAKSDVVVGTLIETRLVNHTEIKGGTTVLLRKAENFECDKTIRKAKRSKLHEMIVDHIKFTSNLKQKYNEATSKANKLHEEVKQRVAKIKDDCVECENSKIIAKNMNREIDELDEKGKNWKAQYNQAKIIADMLKLC